MSRKIKLQDVARWGLVFFSAFLIPFLVGCGGADEHHHGHDDHDERDGHGHSHEAPHGGALAMLGDHALQIEIVPDRQNDRIDLYVLDGEAERFIRITPPSFIGSIRSGEREADLIFQANANQATGETIGNSSHFSASAAGFAKKARFVITFDQLELLGQLYEGVEIPYPDGSH